MKFLVFVGLIFALSTAAFSSNKSEPLSFLTYNAGLAHGYVPMAKQRLPHILSALKTQQADVLCLQEVWEKKDRKKFMKTLKSVYPYVHQVYPKQVKAPTRPACRIKDLFGEGKIVSCFQKTCKGLSSDDFTDCVVNKCRQSLDDLKEERIGCAQALMAQVGTNQILAILRLINPFKKVGIFTYSGSVGTMLFSKYPLKKTGFFDMKDVSALTRRGALYANVETPRGDVHVSCNHISANLESTAPYAGIFSGWREENLVQNKMVADLATSLGQDIPKVVLGDFNASIELPYADVDGDFEQGHLEFLLNGYISPITLPGSAQCTFCKSNNLTDENDDNILIDHVFIKGFELNPSRLPKASVVLKEIVEIKKDKKTKVKTNLSDHFGVLLEL